LAIARHQDHAGLGRAVGGEEGEPCFAGLRGDTDDASAAALGQHLASGGAHAEEDAAQVDGDRTVEPLVCHLHERHRRVADAGVVDCDVDSPEALHCGGEERLDVCRLADVAGVRVDVGAVLFGDLRRLGEAVGVQVQQRQLRAFKGEALGDAAADAASGAGDQGDFVLQEHSSAPSRGLRSG
jgi:hypothetical protein